MSRDLAPTWAAPSRDQLAGPVLDVAPTLLGGLLRVRADDGVVGVRITEVEAYAGERDPGSHAYRGRTARNAVMFGPAGHLYVYRHLGLHHCANVVTGPDGEASAVLVRAGEVVEGVELARRRRAAAGVTRTDVDLARGPARLAVALGLDLGHYGADVVDGTVVELLLDSPPSSWRTGPRVGVSGAGGSGERYPWRLWLADEPTVSVYRPASPPRRRRARDAGASSDRAD